jgi:hypothetical protein
VPSGQHNQGTIERRFDGIEPNPPVLVNDRAIRWADGDTHLVGQRPGRRASESRGRDVLALAHDHQPGVVHVELGAPSDQPGKCREKSRARSILNASQTRFAGMPR